MCPPTRFKEIVFDGMDIPRCGTEIWISGDFEPGDYIKFRRFIRAHLEEVLSSPRFLRLINLYSSTGGDVGSAIEIGELIRRLSFGVQIGSRVEDNGAPYLVFGGRFVSYDLSDGVCSGACVYAWAGGVVRAGNHALIPQPPEIESSVVNASAKKPRSNTKLRQLVESYLTKMSMPQDFTATLLALPITPNEKALPWQYVAKHLSVYADPLSSDCFGTVLIKCRDEVARNRIMQSLFSEFLLPRQ